MNNIFNKKIYFQYQKVAIVRILKAVAKPVLRSQELRNVVTSLDDLVASYRDDESTRLYLSLALDVIQDLYESKDSSTLRQLVHEIFADFAKNGEVSYFSRFTIEKLFVHFFYTISLINS